MKPIRAFIVVGLATAVVLTCGQSAHAGEVPNQSSVLAVPPGYPISGVDVSNHQKTINWSAVAASGQRFAYVKATEGLTFRDPYFNANYDGARSNGLYVGAYHYARPDRSGGREQADHFLDFARYAADGRTLPPMLDIEWPWDGSGSPYPCYGISTSQMVTWIRDFVDRVRERTGQPTMIYTNANWWNPCTGNSTAFGDLPLFVARYESSPNPLPAGWSTWTFWQFTSTASIPGITGNADQDVFNGTEAALAALAGASTPAEPTVAGRWGDFDGDGRPDFAGVAGGDLWVHRGSGSPGTVSFAFSSAPVSSGWGTVSKFLVADMDGDGRSDLIGFNGGDQLMIWRSTSTAAGISFAPYVAYGSGWSIFTRLLPIADYNGDGKPDFAAVAGGDLWIHRNTSTPGAISFAFSNAPVSTGWGTVSKFSASDMDGDGKADIVGFNGGDQLMIWRGTGTATTFSFAPYVAYGSGWSIFTQLLPLADYNGDGKPDFAAVAGGDLWIHRNNSTPGTLSFAFSNAPVSTGWSTVSKFAAADTDVDGKSDLLGYNGGDQLMIWRSTSTAAGISFAPYVAYGSGWSIFNRLLTTAPTN